MSEASLAAAVVAVLLSAFSPPAPAQTSPGAHVAVCFAPEGQCAAAAIATIDAAQQSIHVHAYSFTAYSGFAQALVRAKARGVDVQVIADRTTPCSKRPALPLLAEAAIPVWIDWRPPIAHEKAIIIDSAVVVAGSYNWTVQAMDNSEDLLVIADPQIAAAYLAHWQTRQALSIAYTDPAQWCRKERQQ